MPPTSPVPSRRARSLRPAALAAGAAVALAFLAAPASAQIAIMPKIGTLGIGVDLGTSLVPMVGLRGGFNVMPIEPEGTFSDGDWKVDLPNSFTLGVDVHPMGTGFRVSGGLLFQPDDPIINAAFSGTVEVGGETYTDEEVASMVGVVEKRSAAPYLTLGWGKSIPGVGFFAEAGAAFLGEPDLTVTADGLAADEPSFQAALERERQDIEQDLRDYAKFYPILSVGVKIGL